MFEPGVISSEHTDISSNGSFPKGYQQARYKFWVMLQGRKSETIVSASMNYFFKGISEKMFKKGKMYEIDT